MPPGVDDAVLDVVELVGTIEGDNPVILLVLMVYPALSIYLALLGI